MGDWKQWQVELLGGGLAGISQDMLMHPVDTIRARLDLSRGNASNSAAPTREMFRAVQTTRTIPCAPIMQCTDSWLEQCVRKGLGGSMAGMALRSWHPSPPTQYTSRGTDSQTVQ